MTEDNEEETIEQDDNEQTTKENIEVEENTEQTQEIKDDIMERIAIKGGFTGDNYYTAKEHMLSRCMRSEDSSFAYPFEFTRAK